MDRNLFYGSDLTYSDVALRKESVDRNLSALPGKAVTTVALRKESVDRNVGTSYSKKKPLRRSPQGERG